jgi:hypothetical protein
MGRRTSRELWDFSKNKVSRVSLKVYKSPYQPSAVSGALIGPRRSKKSEITPIDNNESLYASIYPF